MAWTAISSTQTDADSPLDQTLMDAIRNDLDDLNTRVSSIQAFSDHDIRDDFVGTFNAAAVPAAIYYTWEHDFGGAGSSAPTSLAAPDHGISFTNGGASPYSAMRSAQAKMVFDLTRTFSVTMEWRHKSSQSDAAEVWTMGFQDTGLGLNAQADITDQSDFIGFKQGNANTYTAITASGGVTTTVASNQGNAANWTVLKVVITSSTSIEFFVDGSSVGTSTTNITGVELRPFFGFAGGAVARTQNLDYVLAYFGARPLST